MAGVVLKAKSYTDILILFGTVPFLGIFALKRNADMSGRNQINDFDY